MRVWTERRIFLPAVTLLGAILLIPGAHYNSAVASCGGRPSCTETRGAELLQMGESAGTAGPANIVTAEVSQAAASDPLSALRRSILFGAASLRPAAQRPGTGQESFVWPVVGPITQPFGVPELGVGLPHTGIDIGVDAGTPIRASESGRVVFAGGDPCCGLGYWVEINHGNRFATRYGHMMRPPVVLSGDYVTQGQVIGFSGSTGFSTGPHVHFELRLDGVPIDPLRPLPAH